MKIAETPRHIMLKIASETLRGGKEKIESLFLLTEEERHALARRLVYMCFPHSKSKDKDNKPTYGFGTVNETTGAWEIPLTAADLKDAKAGTL
jgi:hypothetical protein